MGTSASQVIAQPSLGVVVHVCVVYLVCEVVTWSGIKCLTNVQCDKECSLRWTGLVMCVDAVEYSLCEVCEEGVCRVQGSEAVL